MTGRIATRAATVARGDWSKDARCALPEFEHVDFFPHGNTSPAPALAVCNECPVTVPCLDEALGDRLDDDHGIRGGVTRGERDRMRRNRR